MAKKIKQPDVRPTIFVDRNLGSVRIIEAIRNAGYEAIAHDDHFNRKTADTDWLAAVGKLGWVVVTADHNINRNVAELEALVAGEVHAFIIKIKNANGNSLAAAIISALPRISQIVNRTSPPSVSIVDAAGRISALQGYDQLVHRIQERKRRLDRS